MRLDVKTTAIPDLIDGNLFLYKKDKKRATQKFQ